MNITAGLEYEERGDGEVIYLVHAGVHSGWLRPLFRERGLNGFRVIRVVRPGYGRSEVPAAHLSLADHARACGRLLRALGVERAFWVGQSSSCCIGLQMALDDPELVAGLVLYEPAKPFGPLREQAASTYLGPGMAAAAHGDIPGAFDIFLRGVGGDGYREALHNAVGAEGVDSAVRESAYFFADEMPALLEWTFGAAEAAAVTAPTLIAHGAESRPWFHENAEILAGLLSGAESITLPGAGHLAPQTHPAEAASVIADFARSRATIVRS
ncbi:pimeloyl-ACP methyl ester carboxylesterase [Pseudonocardia hierapolitana]|uniref:Pimeloyl-ACP methyl ester carboxylesterase n=1 Tax=Pseudonocardia hierapolitana TaxID=1128676 RepID=A0A561SQW9_9PSEU|nr:alpha/beta hydrolase [Pseudonocardia hierapolitana]TWF77273.1 pimeloyl-ACP methyl ester carboxylesterase [Pseudonocardia hierapolitana]